MFWKKLTTCFRDGGNNEKPSTPFFDSDDCLSAMSQKNHAIDILLFSSQLFAGSEELELGLRDLRRRFPGIRRWHHVSNDGFISIADFLVLSDAEQVLVILNPLLLVSDNILAELEAVVSPSSTSAACVLPSDPRGFTPGLVIDYATRSGFDRFVSRLTAGPRSVSYDGRSPWIYLVNRTALVELVPTSTKEEPSWSDVPGLMGSRSVIAGHAFVHSYGDYYLNSRAEMLRLLPSDIYSLLDVGGGYGNFARLFSSQRGGCATLLEANLEVAEAARAQGMQVIVGDFSSAEIRDRYDCVAMLDVLEHLADPLTALVKAHSILRPGGYLLLSVPNVGHWSIVRDLLEGKFEYLPVGILCTTHLRFFTRQSLENLMEEAGFNIQTWENARAPLPESFTSFLAHKEASGIRPDILSLETESFHILASRT